MRSGDGPPLAESVYKIIQLVGTSNDSWELRVAEIAKLSFKYEGEGPSV